MNASSTLQDKIKACFQDMSVYKQPSQNKFFTSLSIPPYLRDWVVMRFADESGKVDLGEVRDFVKKNIPSKRDWELLKSSMINDGQRVRFLAKLRVELDVRTGEGCLVCLISVSPAASMRRLSVLRFCVETAMSFYLTAKPGSH